MHKSWSVHTRCQAMLDAGSAVGFFFLRNNSLKRDIGKAIDKAPRWCDPHLVGEPGSFSFLLKMPTSFEEQAATGNGQRATGNGQRTARGQAERKHHTESNVESPTLTTPTTSSAQTQTHDHMAPVELPAPLEGRKRRIGVMTSGGDAPGMNGAVRAVVRMAIHNHCEAYAIYEGYDGLVKGGDMIREMRWEDVRGFLSEGGTLIGTARCMEFMERDGRRKAAKNMIVKGIDALIICGGDGSLTGADKFRGEWPELLNELVQSGELTAQQIEPFKHLNIVGLVGSIDNDLSMTDATIGCYTSLGRICEAIDSVDTTAVSHQRAFVIEVMGRHCGWLALNAGVATGADFVFTPENPPLEGWEHDMCRQIKKHRAMGKRKTIVVVAEGAIDRNLKKITCQQVKDILSNEAKLDTRITTLGHVQRGGTPCAYDRMLSTLQGAEAVKAVLEATPETPSPVICMLENKIVRRPLLEAVAQTQEVAIAIKNQDFHKAMQLRDTEFEQQYQAYYITTAADQPELMLPENKRMRVGIIHVGAPAGGMNAATRAAVAYCIARGHSPVALHNGFPGIIRHHSDEPIGAVRDIKWMDAETWASKGGSEIGTNRGLPSEDLETTAFVFKKFNIQALLVVGGFEAFTAVSELRKAREYYKAFKIPMVILPATISNNVPGTEYSIGSDTCLNALIQYSDACRQSASASRRRVFVIETQGGESGYIATLAGLSIGALAVYTPEDGINLKMLDRDIDHLRDVFTKDKGVSRSGKVILVNEKASKVYSVQIIAQMIAEAGKGKFESRHGVPGHFQQGTTPSPMDRVRAVRFATKAMQQLETYADMSPEEIEDDPLSVSVIGIKGSKALFSPMESVEKKETEWHRRRPKHEFWMALKEMVDTLSGRPTAPTKPADVDTLAGRPGKVEMV
ncbi:similar to 6-phosphofructokinase alpha subunit [Plenodomus lingam JN3]|uniref:ATP-dependent 6-phosphofructokinase n=2 Tax=Leptosphaeria maculans TaxID=5022 RepID=E5A885_LEPMJ|nr:similar to 6-phosphofructokinase alpha subunit [Plenodomus lingam JN3]CBX99830.1 similar to 6-phosphofructokinase alpha subunit [Plenodomus lingam JN3]